MVYKRYESISTWRPPPDLLLHPLLSSTHFPSILSLYECETKEKSRDEEWIQRDGEKDETREKLKGFFLLELGWKPGVEQKTQRRTYRKRIAIKWRTGMVLGSQMNSLAALAPRFQHHSAKVSPKGTWRCWLPRSDSHSASMFVWFEKRLRKDKYVEHKRIRM